MKYHKVDGYAYVYDPSHPSSKHNGCYKRATAIAEEKIGRKLKKGEVVHHVNRNKIDDSPENLLVITKQQHDRIHVLVSEKCLIENCDKKHHARGLCRKHYQRYYRHNNPMPLAPTKIHIRPREEGK